MSRKTCKGCKMLRGKEERRSITGLGRFLVFSVYCGLGGTVKQGKFIGEGSPVVCPLEKTELRRVQKKRRAAKQTIYACSPAAVETLYAAVGKPLKRIKTKGKKCPQS